MLCATPDSFQFPLGHIDVGGVDDAGIDLDFCVALQALERVVLHQYLDLAMIGVFCLAKHLANSRNSTQQLSSLGRDVGMPHESGANEDGFGAARLQSLDVGPGVDAALGDEHFLGATAPGDALGQALCGAEIDGEVGQVAVVDADQPGVDGQRTVKFGLVVHLHQRGQPHPGGQAMQTAELLIVKTGDN